MTVQRPFQIPQPVFKHHQSNISNGLCQYYSELDLSNRRISTTSPFPPLLSTTLKYHNLIHSQYARTCVLGQYFYYGLQCAPRAVTKYIHARQPSILVSSLVSGDFSVFGPTRDTTASLSQSHEVYACSWGWLTVLLLATTVTLAASLFALWCDLSTNIHDVLGYCSALTGDVPYLDLDGGGTLDGVGRAKLIRHNRVSLGVVDDPEAESLGHIALVLAGEARKPFKRKLYT